MEWPRLWYLDFNIDKFIHSFFICIRPRKIHIIVFVDQGHANRPKATKNRMNYCKLNGNMLQELQEVNEENYFCYNSLH